MCHDKPVEVKGHFGELSSFSPSYGSQVLNSGHQPQWQVPLPAEPSRGPTQVVFGFIFESNVSLKLEVSVWLDLLTYKSQGFSHLSFLARGQ